MSVQSSYLAIFLLEEDTSCRSECLYPASVTSQEFSIRSKDGVQQEICESSFSNSIHGAHILIVQGYQTASLKVMLFFNIEICWCGTEICQCRAIHICDSGRKTSHISEACWFFDKQWLYKIVWWFGILHLFQQESVWVVKWVVCTVIVFIKSLIQTY